MIDDATLFCIPLKHNCLDQYKAFLKEAFNKTDEYKDMLSRYDITSTKIWHARIGGRDYAFVYHGVCDNFKEKLAKLWPVSDHPYDKWFRETVSAFCDTSDIAGPIELSLIADF